MKPRTFKQAALACVWLLLGFEASLAANRPLARDDAIPDVQTTASSSGRIDQAPSVPLAPTGTLSLQDILSHPGIEVVVPPLPAPSDGPTVARHLTERYADTRQDCGASDRPAFLCSGILFRATTPGLSHAWNPNPSSTKGTVSFSWIRRDAKFRTIYTPRYSNGFIFLPPSDAGQQGYRSMEVVCAYPLDASTDARTDLGCGPIPTTDPVNTRVCVDQGIATGAAWVAHYRKANRYTHMCSFDVRPGTAYSAAAFQQVISAMAQLPERFHAVTPGLSFTNELLVRTWPQDIHTTIPIEAFFYQSGTANGPVNARVDQRNFYQSAGRWVPIIRMTLPETVEQEARFEYLPDDQAVSAIPATAHVRWRGTAFLYETPVQPLVPDSPTAFRIPRGNVVATLGQRVEVSFVVTGNAPIATERTSQALPLDVEAPAGALPPPMLAADRSYARIDYPDMLSTDQIWVSYEGNGTHDTPFPKRTAAFNAGIPPSWHAAPDQVYYWVKRGTQVLVSPVVTSDREP